jgi:cell wall-associated NlpC family hydrolase
VNKVLVGAAVTSPFLALVVGLAAIGAGAASPPPAVSGVDVCATTGPLARLSDGAADNARVVVAAAESQGGEAAAVIAVAVGLAESGLRVLGNTDGQQGNLAVQGIGSNLDSLGIFQQRPSWGTVAQRLDPTESTGLFVSRLLADTGWASESPWMAAQDVQRSAYADGSNYKAQMNRATGIVSAVDADAASLTCGGLSDAEAANSMPGSHGLPANYTIPSTASPAAAAAITYAIAQLDKPYVFGAAGPAAFDCSGLTMQAWAKGGVTLPHYTGTQADAGTSVSEDAMEPGDLVLIPGDDGTLANPGHVGIYLGNGLVLSAADERLGIVVQTFNDFIGGGLSTIRHVG